MLKYILILLIQTLLILTVKAQDNKTELFKERDGIKKELVELQKQLSIMEGSRKKSFGDIRIIQDKMATQQRLVDNIGREINMIDRDMTTTQREINGLNAKLDTLKKAYAKSIVYAYKNRNNYNFLAFIFSSNSFNDALKRIQYLKSYRNYRARQAEDIKKYKEYLQGKTQDLDNKKKEKTNVIQNQNVELNEMAGSKNKLDITIKEINSKERNISTEIALRKRKQAKITAMIIAIGKREELARRKAVEAETKRLKAIADAEAKAEAAARAKAIRDAKANNTKPPVEVVKVKPIAPKPKPINEPLYAPAEVALSASFEQNRGKLPFPLQGSYISTRFGLQKLPGGIEFNNESTTFETSSAGTIAVAVFNGTVSSIQEDDGTKTVFITHGKYKSVYANLSSTTVSVGQSVTTGQALGKCATSEEGTGRGVLEFMMFRDNKIENPERWIRH